MQPNAVYIHDRNQLAVYHEASGYIALAPRDLVLCARADEVRVGFPTSFFPRRDPLLRGGVFSARGELRSSPAAEETRWRDAVVFTLDALARLSDRDRHFARLQDMWRSGPQETPVPTTAKIDPR